MTTISFTSENGRLTGFSSKGHSGYAEEGSDIVCAAISSAIIMTECIINDVVGAQAKVRTGADTNEVSLKLPSRLDEPADEVCQAVLTGLMLSMAKLHDDYPENIEVMEV